ncbi:MULTISPECIES: EscI/YscI/HrpB family type III secretion system inner rod protein [Pseudomonas]|uniref:Uncharacterized protein n=1 Tax=Pseudomonas reactans TaxID=117680 RepID=A0A7Y8G0P1_9PSED|nr:EscI/YscI/HrpB family type III secretion system inner rod protein [Pseudomonas reactans]NWE89041.1 hypothetical protein [Pseudomonas reactans]
MLIRKIENPEGFEAQDSQSLPDSTGADADINFFSALLVPSKHMSATQIKSDTSNILTEVSDLFNKSKERTAKRFKVISSNKNLNELRKLPAEFSQTLLTSQLIVKCLGKTTQAIDKICNLQ